MASASSHTSLMVLGSTMRPRILAQHKTQGNRNFAWAQPFCVPVAQTSNCGRLV
jgi:hypothetical protein